ncbi:transposase [Leptolyngbya sp. 15MV]|nr:transposase [Leptolyngbya sp. 7M]QYU67837.1 transposase [Leptolyngbya sp. 15MV]
MNYGAIANKPHVFQSLTGLKIEEFQQLLPRFEQAWNEYVENHHIQGKIRQRRYGGGRKSQLESREDKLLFVLVYFRLYPTQAVQGFLFGLGQPQAHEWVHKLSAVLNAALGYEKQLPEREPHRLEAVLRQYPSLEFIIDGTERRINRPKDKDDQNQYYSGKQKGHTVKNNVISHRRGKVVFLSDTYEGKKHDKAICDEEDYQFPPKSKLWKDTGFQGYEPKGVTTLQPKKKPRNGALTEAEKQRNRAISSERVEIEHQIGGIKRCKIVVDKFRNRTAHYVDDVMETACGLHNFRLTYRQLATA